MKRDLPYPFAPLASRRVPHPSEEAGMSDPKLAKIARTAKRYADARAQLEALIVDARSDHSLREIAIAAQLSKEHVRRISNGVQA